MRAVYQGNKGQARTLEKLFDVSAQRKLSKTLARASWSVYEAYSRIYQKRGCKSSDLKIFSDMRIFAELILSFADLRMRKVSQN